MTHADLVVVARRWLKKTRRCGVVFTEHHGGSMEIPDAIGYKGWHSIQVECKVSVEDFRRDAKKAGRNGAGRQAAERWYLTPVGLLTLDMLPEAWGLIEYDGTRVRQKREAVVLERDPQTWRNELLRLYCEVRRYQAQGIKYQTVTELLADQKARRLQPVAPERQERT